MHKAIVKLITPAGAKLLRPRQGAVDEFDVGNGYFIAQQAVNQRIAQAFYAKYLVDFQQVVFSGVLAEAKVFTNLFVI